MRADAIITGGLWRDTLRENDLARLGIHAVNDGEGLHLVAALAELFTAGLETLLDGDADALDDDAGLVANLEQAVQGATHGQEVVDDDNVLAGVKEALGDDDVVDAVLGEAPDLRAVLLAVEVRGLGLARKDHGDAIEVLGRNAGDADAGGLDRQDLINALALEQARPLGAHLVVKGDIALVVEEVVDFQDVALTDDAVLTNAVFELLHVCPPDDERVETIVHHIATSEAQDIPAGCSFTYTP